MTLPPLSIGAIRIFQGERAHQNLEYSVILDVIPRRDKPEVAAAVREILPNTDLKEKEPFREALGFIVANLFAAWQTFGNPFLAMPMRSSDYAPGSRLRALWLTFKPTTKSVHALHRAGFIELHKGKHFEGEGRRTRIRASEKLVALFIRHRFNLDSVEALENELVELRGPKIDGKRGARIDISRGVYAAMARPHKEGLRRINAALSAASIELHLAERVFIEHYMKRPNGKKTPIPPHPLRNQLRRVFNVDFDHGGRFYSHWAQGIPRELRRFIRINGEPVMELDFKAIHPTLLYAERGLTYEGEMYVPSGWPKEFRPVFKLLMLAAINANNLDDAIKGARDGIHSDPKLLKAFPECLRDGWLRPAFEHLKQKHEPIADQFFTGAGLRLQRKDSEIAERVMLTLLDRGIVAVPIHDSFLVAHPHADALREVMLAASKDVSGVAIPVDEKWHLSDIQQAEIIGLSRKSAPVMDRGALPGDFHTLSTLLYTGGVGGSLSPPRRPQRAAA